MLSEHPPPTNEGVLTIFTAMEYVLASDFNVIISERELKEKIQYITSSLVFFD